MNRSSFIDRIERILLELLCYRLSDFGEYRFGD
uniref:Uncharacterized protein n=1 Tax=MELD virus sp. TaxID=2834287 RepID=A0A8S5L5X7_9VIRU|nr:MAG TPA: hypothetical protein [MELD virus sp.]